MIECEIKLKIEDINTVKEKLLSLGFKECDSVTETDTYFDNEKNDIRLNDQALRIRETINHTNGNIFCQINFKDKKFDNNSMSRPEYESEVASAETILKILSCLGYSPVSPKVRKERIFLQEHSITACLDTVDGLGDFLELEVIVETEKQKDQELEKIAGLLDKIGYSIADTTTTSYLSALQETISV